MQAPVVFKYNGETEDVVMEEKKQNTKDAIREEYYQQMERLHDDDDDDDEEMGEESDDDEYDRFTTRRGPDPQFGLPPYSNLPSDRTDVLPEQAVLCGNGDNEADDWSSSCIQYLSDRHRKLVKNPRDGKRSKYPHTREKAKEGWLAVQINDLGYETLNKTQIEELEIFHSKQQARPVETTLTSKTALWMIGCDEFGKSVCIWIHGLVPYFYVGISHPDESVAEERAPLYAKALLTYLREKAKLESNWRQRPEILGVQVVKRRWMYGYKPYPGYDKQQPKWGEQAWDGSTTQASDFYLRVCAASPYHVNALRKYATLWVRYMADPKRPLPDRWKPPVVDCTSKSRTPVALTIFEANVEYALRCMIDLGFGGSSWCVINTKAGEKQGMIPVKQKRSYCDREYVIDGRIFEQAEKARNKALLEGLNMNDPWEAVASALDPLHSKVCIRFVARKASFQSFTDGARPENDPMHPWFEDLRNSIAPLKIMSFDIECCNNRGSFPDPEEEDGQVINIAARLYRFDRVEAYDAARKSSSDDESASSFMMVGVDPMKNKSAPPFDSVVLGLGTRDRLVNGDECGYPVDTLSFNDEKEMLIAFARLIRVWSPDIIEGYNSIAFDMSYLLRRAKMLGIAKQFWELGRLQNRLSVPKLQEFKNKAKGYRKVYLSHIHGIIQYDVLKVLRDDTAIKERSYTLNNIANSLLGESKRDMPYEEIPYHHNHSNATRAELDKYCMEDARLPHEIERSQDYIRRTIEMARITGVPPRFLLTKGQQVQGFSLILRKSREQSFVVPWIEVIDSQDSLTEARKSKAYRGAIVIDPIVGYYDAYRTGPVVVSDYRGLYPSSIESQNLGFTSHATDPSVHKACLEIHHKLQKLHDVQAVKEKGDPWYPGDLSVRSYEKEGGWKVAPVYTKEADLNKNPVFVRQEVRKSLISQILRELLSARGVAKREMAKHTKGSSQYNVQNSRQLGLKVTANSLYGFTGATVGRLPNLFISASTTAYGRAALYLAKTLAENALPGDNEVIYGDTDSVFVLTKDLATHETPVPSQPISPKALQAIKLCWERCALLDSEINKRVIKPMEIEREKVYEPLDLIKAKKYAARSFLNPEYPYGIDAKGIEMVRRDNPKITGITCKVFMESLLGIGPTVDGRTDRIVPLCPDIDVAIEVVRRVRELMASNQLPFEAYWISAKFTKPAEQYKSMPPHIALAIRMQKRDPSSAPQLGDRIVYVVVPPMFSEEVKKFNKIALYKDKRGVKTFDCAEDPVYAKKRGLWVDTQLYIEKKLEPVFCRLLAPVLASKELNSALPSNPGMFTRQANTYSKRPEKLQEWIQNKREEKAQQLVHKIVFEENGRAKKVRKLYTHSDCAIEQAFERAKKSLHPVAEKPSSTRVEHHQQQQEEELTEVEAKKKVESIVYGIKKQVEMEFTQKRKNNQLDVTTTTLSQITNRKTQSLITNFFI